MASSSGSYNNNLTNYYGQYANYYNTLTSTSCCTRRSPYGLGFLTKNVFNDYGGGYYNSLKTTQCCPSNERLQFNYFRYMGANKCCNLAPRL